MTLNHAIPLGPVDVVGPILVSGVLILLASLVPESKRRELMAIVVAGAGAVYLNNGLGPWEFVYLALATYVAYLGLRSYRWIAVAWLMHTGWDLVHHFYGEPIWSFAPTSSFGCAVCDAFLAYWFWRGAKTPAALRRRLALH